MKRKLFTAIAVILLAAGLAMLIVPRISNRVGEQIAHTTVEDFKALKSKSTYDEPTEKKESSEESTQRENSEAECLRILQVEEKGLNPESRNSSDNVPKIDFDQSPALNLSSYGITNGVYGYISAPSIGMELPIYLGGNDFNMASGAAHMTCTSLPVGGNSTNCVLSGHSGYIGRIFFDYIPNLSIGDEITVENYWNTLTYKVIDKQIHKKDESADCYITEGRDLLTLITCVSNGRGGFDRFYLISERK